jgi:UDP-N-acetylglucosamine 4,6-dehydratase
MFNNSTILITGGTGSLGRAITSYLLKNHPEINKLIILSRDEQKQFQMSHDFPETKFKQIRYFLGDVRDKDRLTRAFQGVNYIIHAAALKHVPVAEYNPDEFIKTNIGGAQNVIHAAIEAGVERVVALSTDKACAPINLYGATKLTSDKLFVAANNIKGKNPIIFSVVRYGNVMGSNGSVIPFFLKKKMDGVIPITDENMTRFNITLEGGVKMVMHALENAWGGEIFIPKIPSYKILDLAKAIAPNCKHEIIGIRVGEKIHEEMISISDSYNTFDLGHYYVILPQLPIWDKSNYVQTNNAKQVKQNFQYNSGENTEMLSIDEIRNLIINHLDSTFIP